MKSVSLFLILISSISFTACTATKDTKGNFSYESQCLGIELDGSQTIKAWGKGRNRMDAAEQARKNALRDVIFNGINKGSQDCNPRPLVPEVNAQMKYERYFNTFFADDGAYTNFLNVKDERILDKIPRDKTSTGNGVVIGVVVRVLRSDLKEQLLQDKILKN